MGFHCTGRNFELAIAIALTAFATMPMVAVSTVVGPLIEIPVMLTIVWMSLRRRDRIKLREGKAKQWEINKRGREIVK